MDNLSKKQINSSCTAVLSLREPVEDADITSDVSEAVENRRHWKKKDIDPTLVKKFIPSKVHIDPELYSEMFELFFDEDVNNYLADMTNKYAHEVQDNVQFSCTAEEIKVFNAILLLTGYVSVPRWRMLWELHTETYNKFVSEAMRRNRFEEIKRYLHCCDNLSLDGTDKFAKMRPLFAMLNERFLMAAEIPYQMAVDESMVPYYGHHKAKQYIKGKPIKFGYKLWCLCDRLGYLIQFEPYQGRTEKKVYGVGGDAILDLLSELPESQYVIYADRFFSSLKLVERLKEKNVLYTGTVQKTRIEKCPVEVKQNRGEFDYRSDGDVLVVTWNDNSPVTMISTADSVYPLSSVKRYKAGQGKIQLPQPGTIDRYNRFMGGVDRLDQNIGYCRIQIRGKKWYWSLYSFCVDSACQNAWQLHRKMAAQSGETSLDYLNFRRKIVQTYLMKFKLDTALGRPKSSKPIEARVPLSVRLDNVNHYLASADQGRCAVCKKNSRKHCQKCRVNLHEKCWSVFHS